MKVHAQPLKQYKSSDVQDSLHALLKFTNQRFIERSDLAEVALVAIAAGKSVVMYGPPGTAKTDLVTTLVEECIDGASIFHTEMHPTKPVESIEGGLDYKAFIEDNEFRLNTQGRAPDCDVLIFEEVGRASAANYDALLTIANEGLHDDGTGRKQCPRFVCFGTSNTELSQDETGAFTDRWLFHIWVDTIQDGRNFMRLLDGDFENVVPPTITKDEILWAIQVGVPAVKVPVAIKEKVGIIRGRCRDVSIPVSDRRWRWIIRALQARAFLMRRDTVTEDDLELLNYCLSAFQSHDVEVRKIVAEQAGEGAKQVADFMATLQLIRVEIAGAVGASDEQKATSAATAQYKIKSARNLVTKAIEAARRDSKDTTKLEVVQEQLAGLRQEVKTRILGMDEDGD